MMKKLVFYSFVSLLFGADLFGQTDPFTQRKTWDGPYDIKMIAAPNLQAVYLGDVDAAAGRLRADSIISNSTIAMTYTLLDINNRYKEGAPFFRASIPSQAFACKDPNTPCFSGLTQIASTTDCLVKYNDPTMVQKYVSMTYADYDKDNSTFSSSMSQLDISKCAEIEAAYLYWTGNFKSNGTLSNRDITLVPSMLNSYTGDGSKVFNTSATSGYKTVKLKKPGGTYTNVTALQTYTSVYSYVCVADVTTQVKGSSGGAFWVADIQSYPNEAVGASIKSSELKGGGSSSGWTMVIIFKSPLSSPRLISLYDGFLNIKEGENQKITLTGLTAPATTNFESYVGFAALDGENHANELVSLGVAPEGLGFQTNGGTQVSINPFCDPTQQKPSKIWTKKGYPSTCSKTDNKDDCKLPLFDENWCTACDGVSSSRISTYDDVLKTNGNELTRLPANTNTLGYDSHFFKLPNGAVAASATTATLTVQAGNQGSTSPFMAFLAIEKLQPKLVLTKKVDKDQTKTGETLTYTFKVVNAGNQKSFGADVLTDTLDPVTKYLSTAITSSKYVKGVKSAGGIAIPALSASGDFQILKFSIPAIEAKDSLEITFVVNVLPVGNLTAANYYNNQCKRTIYNVGWVEYSKNTNGEKLKSKSNSGECNDGAEVKIQIVDPDLDRDPVELVAVDASAIRTESIRKIFKQQILIQKAKIDNTLVPNDTSNANPNAFNTLFYDDFENLISGDDIFPATGPSATYFAYRKRSKSEGCVQKVKITFNFCKAPVFSNPISGNVCSGATFSSGAITSSIATATFSWKREAVAGVATAAKSVADVSIATGISEALSLGATTTSATKVVYKLTPNIGTCVGDTFKLEVTIVPSPAAPVAGTNSDFCEKGTTPVWAATNLAGNTLQWYTVATNGTAVTIPSITNTPSGIREVWVSQKMNAAPNCESGRTPLKLNVIAKPANPTASAPADFCANITGTPVWTANATNATDYQLLWYTALAGPSSTTKPAVPKTVGTQTVWVRQKLTAAAGCISDSVPLSVKVKEVPAKPSISPNTALCVGGNLSLTPSSTTAGVKYFWTKPAGSLADTTSPALVIARTKVAATEAGTYKVTASLNGCVSEEGTLAVVVNDTVSFSTPPKAINNLCRGDILNLSVVAAGTSITNYQWKRTQNGVTTDVGTNAATFTINSVLEADSGSYSVEVTGICGKKTSKIGKVFINTAPVVKDGIVGTGSCVGESADLNVVATGPGTLVYNWKYPDGSPIVDIPTKIAGATTSNLKIVAFEAGKEGDYTVEISNGCTPVAKSVAKITLGSSAVPKVELKIDSTALCDGHQIVLEAINLEGQGSAPVFTFKRQNGTIIGDLEQTASKVPFTFALNNSADATETFTVTMKSNSACATNPIIGASNSVTIYAKPTTPNAGSPKTICDDSYKLNAIAAAPVTAIGKWSTAESGVTFNALNSNTATASNLLAGTAGAPKAITFTWTVKNGTCQSIKSDVIITRSGTITTPTLISDNGDLEVCEGGFLNFSGAKAKPANDEKSGWSWSPRADVAVDTTGVDDNSAKMTFAKAGLYDVSYQIQNATCEPETETIQIKVVAPPVAEILLPKPIAAGKIDSLTFNSNPQTISATAVGTDYVGEWTLIRNIGTLAELASASTVAANSVDKMASDDRSTLVWTVKDANSKCAVSSATLILKRQNVTQALVEDDSLCMNNISSYKLIGNALIAGETANWTFVSSTPALPITVNSDASTLGREATIGSFSIPTNAGKVDLVFEYEIKSPLSAAPNKETMRLRVYEASQLASVTPASITTCDKQIALVGNQPQQSTAKGTWTIVSGQGSLANNNVYNTNLSGLKNPTTTTLQWAIKNGLCLASSPAVLTVTQAGKTTEPKIKLNYPGGTAREVTLKTADSLCAGANYSLDAILPATGLKSIETGTWTTASPDAGINITGTSVSGNSFVPNAGAKAVTVTWTIAVPSIPSCASASTTVTLKTQDVPMGGSVLGSDSLCEGITSTFKVDGLTTSTLPITYTWDAGTLGASRTSLATGSTAQYKFNSDLAGTVVLGSLSAMASNYCGDASAAMTKDVKIKLAPRQSDLVAADTIAGPKEFCASLTGVKYKLNQFVKNVDKDGYVWKYESISIPNEKDTSAIYTQLWQSNASTTAKVWVFLNNICSATTSAPAVSVSKKITITKPDSLGVQLTSGMLNNIFCVPQTALTFTATPKPALAGLIATYQFSVDNGATVPAKSAANTYQPAVGDMTDGATVSVLIEADKSQCLLQYSNTASVKMEGFNYPDSTIFAPAKLSICADGNSAVELKVLNRTKNSKGKYNDNGIVWYKDGKAYRSETSTKNSYSLVLNKPEQTGGYSVRMARNFCSDSSGLIKDSVSVAIYEKPEFDFVPNPFVIVYKEGIVESMPVKYTKLKGANPKTVVQAKWTSGDAKYDAWLKRPDSLKPLIVPIREQVELTYNLTVTTGAPDSTVYCTTSRNLVVINSLPLVVPNAFSPNGDGVNDNWVVTGLNKYKRVTVSVFNRWGNLVFQNTDGYTVPWDGNIGGSPVATGTYYAILELLGSPDNTDQNITRSLTIVR